MSLLSVVEQAIKSCKAEQARIKDSIQLYREILHTVTPQPNTDCEESDSADDAAAADTDVSPWEKEDIELLEQALEKALWVRTGTGPSKKDSNKQCAPRKETKEGMQAFAVSKGNQTTTRSTSKSASLARKEQKRPAGIVHHQPARKSQQAVSASGCVDPGQLHTSAFHSKNKTNRGNVLSGNDLGRAAAISMPSSNNTAPVSHTAESGAPCLPQQNGTASDQTAQWRSLRRKQNRLWDKVAASQRKPVPGRSHFMERIRATFPKDWPCGSPDQTRALVDRLTHQGYAQPSSPVQGENGSFGHKAGGSRAPQGSVMTPPPLPSGLPGPLLKRIEDLRAASRLFDEEGRKKFFTLDMNNILLDIELQVQEQPAEVRSVVYSHLEAFVPCNKEALLKRLKKLSLNIQDDRLRTPLLKLKLAVCSVMPEQIARYNMDCIAKVAKQQSEEGEKNGSEDDDEEKPGKRVMGPRKKFLWDDKLRSLLCNLVRVKLGCYELEGKNSLSLEDYLKAFMETEVKPLWPKGWMQARMLFKESIMAHGHLTGYTAKKKMMPTPKAKPKESVWVQRSTPSAAATPSPAAQVAKRPPPSPSEPICLDSLDDDLTAPSLDSISQALAILGNAAKGLAHGDSPPSPDGPKTATNPSSHHASSPLIQQQQQQQQQQKKNSVSTHSSNTPHYISTSSSSSSTSLSRPPSIASSPLAPVRVDGIGVIKGTVQAHRHSVLNTQRTLGVGVAKANMPASASSPKPRPPPTASPLVAPGSKMGVSAPPSGLLKGSNNNKANSGDTLIITSPQSQAHAHQSASHMTPKTFQTPRLPQTSQSKSSPSSLSQTLPGVQPQPRPQSNFITPMHATLTKSTHSSIPPIVKLTPRTPNPAVTTTTSASPSISQSPRSQATPTIHQYSVKSPAGFRPPFSGAQGGATRPGQGSYTSPGSQKTPNNNSTTNTSLINTISISKHSGSSASPTAASAIAGQRQRPGGGTPQGAKPVASVPSSVSSQLPQVSTAGSGSLLGSAPSLPMGFGMLGGLVPVSLPFQFPPLLNLPPLGAAGSSTAASGSAASSNASFSTLTQNLYKSLQSGSQVALPPHLQLAFSDVSQSQGGDAKRKTL